MTPVVNGRTHTGVGHVDEDGEHLERRVARIAPGRNHGVLARLRLAAQQWASEAVH